MLQNYAGKPRLAEGLGLLRLSIFELKTRGDAVMPIAVQAHARIRLRSPVATVPNDAPKR